MNHSRPIRLAALAAACAFAIASCGSDDTSSADTTVVDTTVVETTEPAPATTEQAASTTEAPATTEATDTTAATGEFDEEQQNAAAVWSLVFDSAVAFDEKAPHIEDAAALQPTIEAYTAAGEGMGGIMLEPTAVVIEGDHAAITFDVKFGGQVAYGALDGEMDRVDGVWVISRDQFCSFMASARNACPA